MKIKEKSFTKKKCNHCVGKCKNVIKSTEISFLEKLGEFLLIKGITGG